MGLTATAGIISDENKQKLTEWMLFAQKSNLQTLPACQ